jgi:hypothetical protein
VCLVVPSARGIQHRDHGQRAIPLKERGVDRKYDPLVWAGIEDRTASVRRVSAVRPSYAKAADTLTDVLQHPTTDQHE